MSLSRNAVLGTLGSTALALVTLGAGVAHAEPGSDGRYYGSMAAEVIDGKVHSIWATDFPGWADADAAALSRCVSGRCTIVARFADGCGSIAFRDGTVKGGAGRTRADAERAAIAAFGPSVPTLSSSPTPAVIVSTQCTTNGG
ncbi:DUF4189 domain-containing protein [Nocardia sp. NBC_01503]|uniref:DUF4189 domain-containing protein n=1 Tax=Nocardia sp. NBC_01503 TaxID=2975997 RepID=UPI002E7B887D|nr:DUF4189 domain-containing protein [Nocardia sp. NBC_01503]WTL29605.1 DUF4189 domain-containing protein [Nocardia sp. NBC_01503]